MSIISGRMFSALSIALVLGAAPAFSSPQEFGATIEDFQETKASSKETRVYSPFAGRNYPNQVLFGDMHFHTDMSFDAGLIGTRLNVDDGYRFARGEEVISNTGQPVQLVRPLDFLVITDHAEFMGLASMIRESDPYLLSIPWGKWIHERFNSGPEGRLEAFRDVAMRGIAGNNPFSSDEGMRSVWKSFVEKAEAYNQPGRFTAMTGFEWT